MAKLSGETRWIEFDSEAFAVDDAIVEEHHIAFDPKDGKYGYAVAIDRAPGDGTTWLGTWRGRVGRTDGGRVEVRRYDSKEGGITLIGTWQDGKNEVPWITELRPQN